LTILVDAGQRGFDSAGGEQGESGGHPGDSVPLLRAAAVPAGGRLPRKGHMQPDRARVDPGRITGYRFTGTRKAYPSSVTCGRSRVKPNCNATDAPRVQATTNERKS
jgi:hypothetical protein